MCLFTQTLFRCGHYHLRASHLNQCNRAILFLGHLYCLDNLFPTPENATVLSVLNRTGLCDNCKWIPSDPPSGVDSEGVRTRANEVVDKLDRLREDYRDIGIRWHRIPWNYRRDDRVSAEDYRNPRRVYNSNLGQDLHPWFRNFRECESKVQSSRTARRQEDLAEAIHHLKDALRWLRRTKMALVELERQVGQLEVLYWLDQERGTSRPVHVDDEQHEEIALLRWMRSLPEFTKARACGMSAEQFADHMLAIMQDGFS